MGDVTFLRRQTHFSDESPLYFRVYERPVFFGGKTKQYTLPDHKAIVRIVDEKKPICIGLVGKNYKVIRNQELCQEVERTLVETLTDAELRGVQTKDSMSYHGGMCFRQYMFPAITTSVGDRSVANFRIIIVNGYDGSSSFKLYSGAIDSFCENGMVSGVFDMMIKRHTAGLTLPNIAERVRRSIDIFYKQAEQWKYWVGKEITEEQAYECLCAMPNASARRVEQLMRQYAIECLTHGKTVWALYSAATYYASHTEGEFKVRETPQDHTTATLLNREKQIRAWTSTDEFERLAA